MMISHGESVIPGVLGPGPCPGLVFLARVVHLKDHIRLQTQALGTAQLRRPHHANLQLPRALASDVVDPGLDEAVLTKRWVCLYRFH